MTRSRTVEMATISPEEQKMVNLIERVGYSNDVPPEILRSAITEIPGKQSKKTSQPKSPESK